MDGPKVGLFYYPFMLLHKPPSKNKNKNKNREDAREYETPDRLLAVWNKLKASDVLERCECLCECLCGTVATREEILRVHTGDYFDLIYGLSTKERNTKRDKYAKDTSTYFNKYSRDVASMAAGSVIMVSVKVACGGLQSAIALVRPPGHHALPTKARGFCIFNNVAIAARHLLNSALVKKILIVDIDVHHGDGTQKIFEEDTNV